MRRLALGMAACLGLAGPAAQALECPPPANPNKTFVCHLGDAGWVRLEIAKSAKAAHLAHGDGLPGAGDFYCDCRRAVNDADLDGITDTADNCLGVYNPGQADADGDGFGDACDSCPFDAGNDVDGDGRCAASDNCPNVANANQVDVDADGLGDACDPCPSDPGNDVDGDGRCAENDNCPSVANANQVDVDADGLGDACDPCPADAANDADGDGICDPPDNCPSVANPDQADVDGDGLGDACDPCPIDFQNDADADGRCESEDNCDAVFNPDQADLDADGLGDACDPCPADPANDVDNDGICAADDNCPSIPNPGQEDGDLDGVGDPCDACPEDPENDADGDGACFPFDNCPGLANPDQADTDGDGIGDACDPFQPAVYTIISKDEEDPPGPDSISHAILDLGDSSLSVSPVNDPTAGSGNLNISTSGMAVSPDGSMLFVGHNSSNAVEGFRLDADGSLVTPGSSITAGMPLSIVVHPTQPVAYAVDQGAGFTSNIQVVLYDSGTGVLSPGADVPVADNCRGIAIDRDATVLVSTHMFAPLKGIQVRPLDAFGNLGASTNYPIAGAGRPTDAVFSPTGSFLYVGDVDRGIYGFTMSGGVPTLIPGSPWPAGSFLHDMAMSPEGVLFVLSSTGGFATADIRRFVVGAGGALTELPLFHLPARWQNIALSRDGRTLVLSARKRSELASFSIAPGTFDLTEAPGSPYAVVNPAGATGNIVIRD